MEYIITFSAVIIGFLIALFLKPQKKKEHQVIVGIRWRFPIVVDRFTLTA